MNPNSPNPRPWQFEQLPVIPERNFSTRYPYLLARFEDALQPEDVSALRGAIIKKVGRSHDHFHNHGLEGEKLHRYPLIQYKSLQGQAAVLAIGEGVEELQQYLSLRDRSLRIGQRELRMDLIQMQLRSQPLRAWQNYFSYRIRDYIGLHGSHFENYRREPRLAKRIALLETKLNSNIRSFTRSLGWSGDGKVDVRIHHFQGGGHQEFKEVQFRTFDIEFSCNVFLPPGLSLGKGSAFGFGILQPNYRKP